MALLFSGCCDNHLEIPGIRMHYDNVADNILLFQVRLNKSDINEVVDTISLGELNMSNSFMYFHNLSQNDYHYVFFTSDSNHLDTISHATFDYGKCNEMENLTFLLNGVSTTSKRIIME